MFKHLSQLDGGDEAAARRVTRQTHCEETVPGRAEIQRQRRTDLMEAVLKQTR